MKWPNAIGFCLIGMVMLWLPALAPDLFTSNAAFGTSIRELWLLFMGTVNTSVGAGVLGWEAIKQAWRIPVWLEPVATPQPTAIPRPSVLPQPSRV